MNWVELVNGIIGAIISESISCFFRFFENKKLKKDKCSISQKLYNSGQIAEGDFNQQIQLEGNNNTINVCNVGSKKEQNNQSWKGINWFAVLGFVISLIIGIIAAYTSERDHTFSSGFSGWQPMKPIFNTYIYLDIAFSVILCISFFLKRSYVYKKKGIFIISIVCCIFTIGVLLFSMNIENFPNYNVNIFFGFSALILLSLIFAAMFGLSFAKNVKFLILTIAVSVGGYILCFIGANTIGIT